MTSPAPDPPAIPWATIQSQPSSPIARRSEPDRRRRHAAGRRSTGGSARTSAISRNANDSPTASAAPARYTTSGSRLW